MKDNKLEHFKRYGWKCNEKNLQTLPITAPQEAKDLTKWLTLEGRRSSLEEWIGCMSLDTGRIHGKFWHIGAWTGRMSHSSPNQANVMASWPDDKKPTTPVEEIKAKYDSALRSCFKAADDTWLVGTDAEGIQLRVLAHYMESETYRDAILKGDSSKGTDIHSVNMRGLGALCRDRDTAKTFIYAWLLGAGNAMVSTILRCTTSQAAIAINSFLDSLPELKRLRKNTISRDAARGYFIGLDGRRVRQTKEHLMLAGYLQNGEAVIMKMATLKWIKKARAAGIQFKLVDFVHDEWQTEVYGSKEEAELLGKIQCEAIEEVGEELGLFCPLAGKSSIGKNWKETH